MEGRILLWHVLGHSYKHGQLDGVYNSVVICTARRHVGAIARING
jgi:hypothetical protein